MDKSTKYCGCFPEGIWDHANMKVILKLVIRLKYFRVGWSLEIIWRWGNKFREGEWLDPNHTTRNSKI